MYDVFETSGPNCGHLSHKRSKRSKGLPGEVRALFSPGKEKLPPKELRGYLRGKGLKFDADGKMAKLVGGYMQTLRAKGRKAEVPTEARGRYGGLVTYLKTLEAPALMERGLFNQHIRSTFSGSRWSLKRSIVWRQRSPHRTSSSTPTDNPTAGFHHTCV